MRLAAAAAAAPLLLSLSACVVPVPETVYSPCHASGSGGWTAAIEPYRTAHGQPRTRHNLVVSGEVTVPSGGHRVWLEEGPLQSTEPRTRQVLVRTDPPDEGATMALVTHRVRAAFPSDRKIAQVAIRCGDGILAEVPVAPAPA